jgi:hypothetical protein
MLPVADSAPEPTFLPSEFSLQDNFTTADDSWVSTSNGSFTVDPSLFNLFSCLPQLTPQDAIPFTEDRLSWLATPTVFDQTSFGSTVDNTGAQVGLTYNGSNSACGLPQGSPQGNFVVPERVTFSFSPSGLRSSAPHNTPINPTYQYMVNTPGIHAGEEINDMKRWGLDLNALPPTSSFLPSHSQHDTSPAPRVTHSSDTFNYEPYSFHAVYKQPIELPSLPECLRYNTRQGASADVAPMSTRKSKLRVRKPVTKKCQPVFEPLSPHSSTSDLSYAPSPSSSSNKKSLRKRKSKREDPLVDSSGARLFTCQWNDCREQIIYFPKSEEGGLPANVRIHLRRHWYFPGVPEDDTVHFRWGSVDDKTPKRNLRKRILHHIPQFYHQCPACKRMWQRQEVWRHHALMDKCGLYHAYLKSKGGELPSKIAETDTPKNKE